MKHTKGKVKVSISSQFGIRIITKDGLGIAEIFEGDGSTEEINEAEANAELIAEAFNVAEECGLTPRQLLAQRDELLELIKTTYNMCDKLQMPTESDLNTLKQSINNAINNIKKLPE